MDLDEPAKNLNSLHFQPPLSPSQNSISHFHFLPHATSDLQLQNVSARIFHDSSLAMAIRSRSSPRVLAFLPVDFIMLMHSLNSKELILCNSLSSKFYESLFFFGPLGRTNRATTRLLKKMLSKIQETLYFLAKYPVFIVFGSIVLAFTVFGDKIKLESP